MSDAASRSDESGGPSCSAAAECRVFRRYVAFAVERYRDAVRELGVGGVHSCGGGAAASGSGCGLPRFAAATTEPCERLSLLIGLHTSAVGRAPAALVELVAHRAVAPRHFEFARFVRAVRVAATATANCGSSNSGSKTRHHPARQRQQQRPPFDWRLVADAIASPHFHPLYLRLAAAAAAAGSEGEGEGKRRSSRQRRRAVVQSVLRQCCGASTAIAAALTPSVAERFLNACGARPAAAAGADAVLAAALASEWELADRTKCAAAARMADRLERSAAARRKEGEDAAQAEAAEKSQRARRRVSHRSLLEPTAGVTAPSEVSSRTPARPARRSRSLSPLLLTPSHPRDEYEDDAFGRSTARRAGAATPPEERSHRRRLLARLAPIRGAARDEQMPRPKRVTAGAVRDGSLPHARAIYGPRPRRNPLCSPSSTAAPPAPPHFADSRAFTPQRRVERLPPLPVRSSRGASQWPPKANAVAATTSPAAAVLQQWEQHRDATLARLAASGHSAAMRPSHTVPTGE